MSMRLVRGLTLALLAFWLTPGAVSAELKDTLEELSRRDAPSFNDAQFFDPSGPGGESLTGKVLLVNFWATWCPPCIEELPSIQQTRESFSRDNFEVVAVNAGETPADIEAFLPTLPVSLTFPIVLDQRLAVYADWQVRPLPTTFLVDRHGVIRYQAIGPRDFASDNIRSIIQGLIDE